MKKNENILIAGVGALLAYFFVEKNKKKKLNASVVSIFPTEFFEE